MLFKIWKVKGHSMAPVIPSGCFVLVVRRFYFLPLRQGQRLVINHPKYGAIVKKIALVDRNGFIWSKGENAQSLSVEELGPIDKSQILGRVVYIFKPQNSVQSQLA